DAVLNVNAGLTQRQWPPDESTSTLLGAGPLHVENWQRVAVDFSAAVPEHDDWEAVQLAFESMEHENALMREAGAFDTARLERVRDRDLSDALEVLARLTDQRPAPWRRVIGRP